MKKVIAIVAGGDSSEHDVSLRSAAGIDSWIDKEKYDVYIVEVSRQEWVAHLSNGKKSAVYRHNFSFKDEWGRDVHPDYAYITIHGTPGEDGVLQGYFDLLNIPYSTDFQQVCSESVLEELWCESGRGCAGASGAGCGCPTDY